MNNKNLAILAAVPLIACSSIVPINIETTAYENALSHIRSLEKPNSTFSSVNLKGGYSGSNLYKVSTNNKSYVIRLLTKRSLDDRKREIQALEIASSIGYDLIFSHMI